MTRGLDVALSQPSGDEPVLRPLPLFADLTRFELHELAARVTTIDRAAGTYVFRQGEPGDALYVVVDGQVALDVASATSPRTVALCGPGDWFGEMALLGLGTRSADARVTLDARLLRIDRAAWADVAAVAPQVFARLCERLARQLRAANEDAARVPRVIACLDATGRPPTWFEALGARIRRQLPGRAVHVVGTQRGTSRHAVEDAIARILTPDAIVLFPGEHGVRTAHRSLVRESPRCWRLASGPDDPAPRRIAGDDDDALLDRVARHVAGATVGLALGAGGAYGLAHIGLLDALDTAGVPIDFVAGTSMGAIVGAAVAAGMAASEIAAVAERAGARFASIVVRDLDLFGSSLLRGTGVHAVVDELSPLAGLRFEELLLPFVAVATDIGTGDEVLLRDGVVLDAIRPSYAMPGILPACSVDGRTLVDGAMVNPVPVDRVRALGADCVIASQPVPRLAPATEPDTLLARAVHWASLLPVPRLRGSIDSLGLTVRSFQALWHHLAMRAALRADASVVPDLRRFSFLQFGAARLIIEAGRQAAEAALPEIRAAIRGRVGLGC